MTHTAINEKVVVYVLYPNPQGPSNPHERMRPVFFVWRNKAYRVHKITYVWRERLGDFESYHYAVSDGANVYELCYETKSFVWTLLNIYCAE